MVTAQKSGTEPLMARGWAPAFLDRRVGSRALVVWWALATAIFVGVLLYVSGGPSQGDYPDSEFATVAIAHDNFACSYSATNPTPTPPLYPLLSGAVLSVSGTGGSSVIPGLRAATTCQQVDGAIEAWFVAGHGRVADIGWIGLIGWFSLLGGFVALIRSIGRGRRGWEVAGLLALAVTPACSQCIDGFLHPNDLLAMGLVLGALAACFQKRWGLAGLLLGLGMASQQFVLLAAIPLVILIPREGRWRFITRAALATAAVVVPFGLVTGGAAFASQAGQHATFAASGTWVDLLNLSGVTQLTVARVLPLVLCAALAWWARQRGGDVWSPPAMLSIVCLCLGFRLIFETSLWGYYFMATAAMLIVVDWSIGRLRYATIAWIAAVGFLFRTIAFDRPVVAPVTQHQPVLVQLVVLAAFFVMVSGPLLEHLPRRIAETLPAEDRRAFRIGQLKDKVGLPA
jgi:hypothetical protein